MSRARVRAGARARVLHTRLARRGRSARDARAERIEWEGVDDRTPGGGSNRWRTI